MRQPASRQTIVVCRLLALLCTFVCLTPTACSQQPSPVVAELLSDSQPLTWDGALDKRLMRGAHAFVERKIAEAVAEKPRQWKRDLSSREAYQRSIEPNRRRLAFVLGADRQEQERDTHVAFPSIDTQIRMERIGDDQWPSVVLEDSSFGVSRVRWPVLNGVHGEGLLLEPKAEIRADVIVIPDADQSPEELVGLQPGVPAERQLARILAASGARVLIPVLINRQPVNDQLNQSNREWIYRQSFHMGRHIIGYEIDKVRAAIDWFESTADSSRSIGLAGWGEGGRLSLFAAALDQRVDATLLSGDWLRREPAWREPIYRNVWSFMREFDNADLASMLAPNKLIVEDCIEPAIDPQRDKALPLDEDATRSSIAEAAHLVAWDDWLQFIPTDATAQIPYATKTQSAFATALGIVLQPGPTIEPQHDMSGYIDERHARQMRELDDYTQQLVRDSELVRRQRFLDNALPELKGRQWSTQAIHPTTPLESFTAHLEEYRRRFADDVLGRFDDALLPPNPRARKIKSNENWSAIEVVLDVVPEMFAWGILMVPHDIQEGERRPVVVIQHGRNGLPQNVMDGGYNGIAEKLLERGFIVFAPHNCYRGEDEYRWLDRKANAIGKSLFSFLLLQHEQITRWLAELPPVDGERIAFYGNSYGGESAVRIPTVITNYALSICASDFNDWTRKVADTHDPHSFMTTIEWEMPYFNMGSTFSYAEMAYLMVPRPFMVERGHHDLVAPDHWVASEYAKVRLVYDQLGLSDRTAITFFQGGHTMRGEATVEFLVRHLAPVREAADSPAVDDSLNR